MSLINRIVNKLLTFVLNYTQSLMREALKLLKVAISV